MIYRYITTLVVVALAFVLPRLFAFSPPSGIPQVPYAPLNYVGTPVAFFALAGTRRWGKHNRLLFRKRPADERESRLMAETDSISITVFIVVALCAPVVFLLGFLAMPVQWRMALGTIESPAWFAGPRWFPVIRSVANVLQSTMLFIVLQSIVGIVKFSRDR